MPTAAAVIIGEEILTGKFADENGPFLIRRLRALGCDLRHVAIIGDEVPEIGDEVARLAERHDFVLTTGGVGPTHDDRTFEGVAHGFSLPLQEHPELLALLDRHGLERSETNLRMARVPLGTTLVMTPMASFPVVCVRNVWIFPGIPTLMHQKFEEVAAHFAGDQMHCERVYVDEPETAIAGRLQAVAEQFPSVNLGSYPRFGEAHRVILTLESRDVGALQAATAALRRALALTS